MIPIQVIASEIESNLDILNNQSRDASDKHYSIRAVFEHSWQQLSKQEQRILKALAVLKSSFDFQAVQQLSGASIMEIAILCRKSLLRLDDNTHYSRHPLLSQFCLEKILEDKQIYDATRTKHKEYFFSLIQEHQAFQNSDHDNPPNSFIKDLANLSDAWRWMLKTKDWQTFLTCGEHVMWLSTTLLWSHECLDLLSETHEQLSELNLENHNDPTINQCLAKVLLFKAILSDVLGNFQEGIQFAEESIKFSKDVNTTDSSIAKAHFLLGRILQSMTRYEEAQEHLEYALEGFEQLDLGIDSEQGRIYEALASLELDLGNPQKGVEYAEHYLQFEQKRTTKTGIVNATRARGLIALRVEDYDTANRCFQECFAFSQSTQNILRQIYDLTNLSAVAIRRQNSTEGERYIQEAWDLNQKLPKQGLEDPKQLVSLLINRASIVSSRDLKDAFPIYKQALMLSKTIDAQFLMLRVITSFSIVMMNQEGSRTASWLKTISEHPKSDAEVSHWAKHFFQELPEENKKDAQDMGLEHLTNDILLYLSTSEP